MIIKFTQKTNYTGRHGLGIASGIEVLKLIDYSINDQYLNISPITSRSRVTSSCFIQVPVKDLLPFIKALTEDALDEMKEYLKEAAPLWVNSENSFLRNLANDILSK